MFHWLGIHLVMKGTSVRSLVPEEPTCHEAGRPVCHDHQVQALETRTRTTEPACCNHGARMPRFLAPQQDKQGHAWAPRQRAAPLSAARESLSVATKTHNCKKKKINLKKVITDLRNYVIRGFQPSLIHGSLFPLGTWSLVPADPDCFWPVSQKN